MKETYKKIKPTSPAINKITSTNNTNNKPSMIIKVSSNKNQKEKESKNVFHLTKEHLTLLGTNLNKLKTDIDLERNNTMKDTNELNIKLKELNNEINSLETNNKYLMNNINNMKKKNARNNTNINLKKGNSIDKLNKKIKLNENMILNNKHNIKLLKKEKNFLKKEIKENDVPEQKENLEKKLEDIFKNENEIKKDIEKLNIIKNEHEIVCKRKLKEYNKKIEIIKREIEYELKKKEIYNKIANDKIQNNNKKKVNKLNNITDINIITDSNKNNDITRNDSEGRVKKYINKNIFNRNSNDKRNIFNFYLRQLNENKAKKRKEHFEIKKLLNSNIDDNNINEIKSFSNIKSESNNGDVLNIKLVNNKNNSQTNRTLFTKSEKDFLLKLIPDKCLDNYENKYDSIMKENLSLQSKLNDKIRLKSITKQNNLIKLENSELINNVHYKKKLLLDSKMNESNKKKHEINERLKKNKRLLNYYDTIYKQKVIEYNQLLKKYRNFYDQIKKGKLFLKKGEQLTEDNILCMDKYGKKEEDSTIFNDINDNEDHGLISENYEESEDKVNINENNKEFDANNNEDDEEEEEEEK